MCSPCPCYQQSIFQVVVRVGSWAGARLGQGQSDCSPVRFLGARVCVRGNELVPRLCLWISLALLEHRLCHWNVCTVLSIPPGFMTTFQHRHTDGPKLLHPLTSCSTKPANAWFRSARATSWKVLDWDLEGLVDLGYVAWFLGTFAIPSVACSVVLLFSVWDFPLSRIL